MTISMADFEKLSREDQFAEAGRIANVNASVFDGLWRTESGRGTNMLGPRLADGDLAEGHFQLIGKTRRTMEQRIGSPIDPYNFGHSLYVSALLMRENMGKWKNTPDALRAWNGGWDASKWGNKETAAFAGKVLGTDEVYNAANPTAHGTVPSNRLDAFDMLHTPMPGAPQRRSLVSAAAREAAATPAAPIAPVQSTPAVIPAVKPVTSSLYSLNVDKAAAAAAAVTEADEHNSFLSRTRAAAFPVTGIVRALTRDAEPIDPAWVTPRELTRGTTADIKEQMAATSKVQLDRVLFDQEYRADMSAHAFSKGAGSGTASVLIAELPLALVTGAGATRALGAMGMGALTAARAGQTGKALASASVEGALANTAYTAVLDAVGERQGASAYALGALLGPLNALFMRGTINRAAAAGAAEAADVAERTALASQVDKLVANELALAERASTRLGPDATPEDVRIAMTAIEAEDAIATRSAATAAIPPNRGLNVGDASDLPDTLAPPKAAPAAKATAEAQDNAVVDALEASARKEAADKAYWAHLRAAQATADKEGVIAGNNRVREAIPLASREAREAADREAARQAQAPKNAARPAAVQAEADATAGLRRVAEIAQGEMDAARGKAGMGIPRTPVPEPIAPKVVAPEPTPAPAAAVPEMAAIREALEAVPEAKPILAALDEALPAPVAAVPEVVPAIPEPVAPPAVELPLAPKEPVAPTAPKAKPEPKLGKAQGQGELHPLTPTDKKAIAAAQAAANKEALAVEPVPGHVADGQGTLDFSTPKAAPKPRKPAAPKAPAAPTHGEDGYPLQAFKGETNEIVNAVHGRTILEVADWVAKTITGPLAPIAQRAAAQLRALQQAGLIIGEVAFTKPGTQIRGGSLGVATLTGPRGKRLGEAPSTATILLGHPSGRSGATHETIVHELWHSATSATIRLAQASKGLDNDLTRAVDDLRVLHKDLIKHFNAQVKHAQATGTPLGDFEQAVFNRRNNAMADMEESMTWALTNTTMQQYLETIPYKTGTMWSAFVQTVRAMMGMSPSQDTLLSAYLKVGERLTSFSAKELDGASQQIWQNFMKSAPDATVAQEVADFVANPTARQHGLDRLPMATVAERAEAKQILALYEKASSPEYVVDEKRLSWLLSKASSFDATSNIMLRSKNPVLRMAAIELVENGGGAAGRRTTAAVAKDLNDRAIVGNAIVDIGNSFNTWFKTQAGASHVKEAFTGKGRAQYDRLVAQAIEQRRLPTPHTTFEPSVEAGADAVEAAFNRARLMQRDAKTIGWAALPESSRGYIPHSMKSAAYRDLTQSQVRALHGHLAGQFVEGSGFDAAFAGQLASKYLDRVNARALGGFDSPMGLHQTGAHDVVREALEAMQLNRAEVDAAMKRYVSGGAGHTKKRLNLDLNQDILADDGSSFKLIDLYDTDMLSLIRGQSQRISGEAALARHGVMGKSGLAVLRRAMHYGADGAKLRGDMQEIGAFDQVSAEFLGSPQGTANKYVDRAVTANSVLSLGGMMFNQLAETANAGFTLGWNAVGSNLSSVGRLRGEIKALARGEKVHNGLLQHVEFMGGAEFGTDAYKMVFPMDNPGLFANSMGPESVNYVDRALRGAGHLQSRLSLWRTVSSIQTRGVAEQIVLKAARAMKSGANDYHLRDMGMDDGMFARLKADMPNIVKYDKAGRVVEFDITKATDKEAAYQFIQGVHRGARQIIQGAFIGESGKYVHNSWLRMLAQFRTFSITSIDKQFNRQLGNRGPAGAVMMSLGAMSMAAPIYLARVYAASVGRADAEAYIERHTTPGAMLRAMTNYIPTAGLSGDFLDAFTAVTGTGDMTGGRGEINAVGTLIAPAVGRINAAAASLQNSEEGTDWAGALQQTTPLGRLPYVIPFMNMMKELGE